MPDRSGKARWAEQAARPLPSTRARVLTWSVTRGARAGGAAGLRLLRVGPLASGGRSSKLQASGNVPALLP
eukprot:4989553-Heterocapsa_arctica.AAC.1